MNEEKLYTQIQDYLQGNLTPEENQAFELEMANNTAIQEEVDLHLLADDAIELIIEDELRGDLQGLAQKNKNRKGGKVVKLRRRLYQYSAAAMVLILVGVFGMIQIGNYSNGSLASGNYQNEFLETRRGSSQETQFNEAIQKMRQSDFAGALEGLDGITDPALVAEANYGAGHAHYSLKNYEAAKESFDMVIQSNDPRLKEKAEWFFLLSGLELDIEETEEFTNVLDRILGDEDHLYYREAMQLNKKLKSFWRNF